MAPTIRAFRFLAYGRSIAVDIQDDTVYLLAAVPGGWEPVPEFAQISATNADINAAGGPVRFADIIIAAVNVVLRILGAKPKPDDMPPPREDSLQDAVLSDLVGNVRAWELMDGTVELQRKQP